MKNLIPRVSDQLEVQSLQKVTKIYVVFFSKIIKAKDLMKTVRSHSDKQLDVIERKLAEIYTQKSKSDHESKSDYLAWWPCHAFKALIIKVGEEPNWFSFVKVLNCISVIKRVVGDDFTKEVVKLIARLLISEFLDGERHVERPCAILLRPLPAVYSESRRMGRSC